MENTLILAELGKRIKHHRTSRSITQQELAARCGIEKSNMSRLESGKGNTSVKTLNNICLALGMTLCEMCDEL